MPAGTHPARSAGPAPLAASSDHRASSTPLRAVTVEGRLTSGGEIQRRVYVPPPSVSSSSAIAAPAAMTSGAASPAGRARLGGGGGAGGEARGRGAARRRAHAHAWEGALERQPVAPEPGGRRAPVERIARGLEEVEGEGKVVGEQLLELRLVVGKL